MLNGARIGTTQLVQLQYSTWTLDPRGVIVATNTYNNPRVYADLRKKKPQITDILAFQTHVFRAFNTEIDGLRNLQKLTFSVSCIILV